MHVRSRSFAVAGAAATVTAALAVALAAPASAVTTPSWETGRLPTGCPVTNLTTDSTGLVATFTDSQEPVVRSLKINGSTSAAVLVPGPQPMTWSLRATQTCSGVADTGSFAFKYSTLGIGSGTFGLGMTATTTNAFDQVLEYSFTASPAYAGKYQTPYVQLGRRYDSFILDGNFGYVSSVAAAAPTTFQTGAWSSQINYLLLKTTIATSASKSTVAAGGSVTFRATLNKAGATTYVPAVGSKVVFQTKIGSGAWTTRTTVTANTAGAVSYTFKPSKTMVWRWVHLGDKATTFTAPVNSTVKKITVT